MKKKIYIGLVALAATACDYNDKYFDGLDEMVNEAHKNVVNESYTLTADDYATISKYKALDAADESELKNLAKNQAFSSSTVAIRYIPTFVASKYSTVDETSAIKVTYNVSIEKSAELVALNKATLFKLDGEDYVALTNDAEADYLLAEHESKIADLLANKYTEVEEGSYTVVSYDLATMSSSDNDDTEEPAEVLPSIKDIITAGNADEASTQGTVVGLYARGFLLKDETGSLLIYQNAEPTNKVGDVVKVTGKVSQYNGLYQISNCTVEKKSSNASFTLPVAKEVSDAELKALTSPEYVSFTGKLTINQEKGYYDMVVGETSVSLSYIQNNLKDNSLDGQTITVCGYYIGVNKSGVVQIMAMSVGASNKSAKVASRETKYVLYKFDGSKWTVSNDAYLLSVEDYKAMGMKNNNLSTTNSPEIYLPKFLQTKYVYATEGTTKTVAYLFYNSSNQTTFVNGDKYVLTDGQWVKAATSEAVTDQFVLNSKGFTYDPSVVITLAAGKGIEASALFYQTVTDWVWENVDTPNGITKKGDGYVTSYGNNEYYTGASAYQNNVDLRAASARDQYSAEYGEMSDEEVVAAMKQRVTEVFGYALSALYPDATNVEGIEVTYTINFVVYDGTSHNYQIVYKVTGPATFEYVEGSLTELN